MSKESLWDIAVKKNLEADNNDSCEKTLILAGSQSSKYEKCNKFPDRALSHSLVKQFHYMSYLLSNFLDKEPLKAMLQHHLFVVSQGKSKMIQRFLDQNDPIKKTLAIEYCFGRKSGRSLSKDICHVWELGGGVLFTNLLNFHIGKDKNTTLVLVLDLSSPETLWHVLETILQSVYKVLQKKELSGEFEPCGNRIDRNHEDYQHISAFPMPLVIVGAKYDLFEGFEPEKRKVICRTLRQVAHSLAASLIFYSDKNSALVKKLKDVFHQHGFGGSQWKGYCTDYNKPLMIPFGSDSFQRMDVNTKSWSSKTQGLFLERFKHGYTTLFPQNTASEELTIPDDPAKNPNFKEPVIDLLRSQKDEELERYRLEKEQKKRITSTIMS